MIVPWAAGGPTDSIGRVLTQKMADWLGTVAADQQACIDVGMLVQGRFKATTISDASGDGAPDREPKIRSTLSHRQTRMSHRLKLVANIK